jgi:hypothetical protein
MNPSPDDSKPSEEDFWNVYERLAEEGLADNPGGFEYRRVLDEWKASRCPKGIEHFITIRTNDVGRAEEN